MAQLIGVKLSRFDGSPWGFRLQGGKDFGTPLVVQKVNGGSPAEAAGLRAGDAVIRVNSTDMFNLKHKDAQDVIVRAGNNFEMTVQRGGGTWKPSVTPITSSLPTPAPTVSAAGISPVTKTSLAAKKQDAPLIGSGHNFTPKPFLNGTSDGAIKSIVNKQYNSPVGIYSEETIAETLSAQAEVLAGGVLGVNFKKNEKNYNAENSEVFKMVQEADKEPKTPEPAEPIVQSGVITPSSPALAGLRPVSAPETRPQQQPSSTPQATLPPGQNICAECERLIVGVFVRIKEKNLHVECFKCSTCGTSLKNVGYYNINNKLYCDIHAKMVARQNAPAGMIPVTVPPGGKAPVSTISAALAHVGAPLSPPLSNHGSSPQPFSPTRLGASPVDQPALRPVQAPTSNSLIGPKPFGAPSSLSTNLSSTVNFNSQNSTLPRPQSQTVTGRFSTLPMPKSSPFRETHEKSYYYEIVEETKSAINTNPDLNPNPSPSPSPSPNPNTNPAPKSTSVKSRSLTWPPPKPIEEITYPTASPLYIDPNPALDRRSRQAVHERRASVEACERALSRRRSVSADFEIDRSTRADDPMDRVSCHGPVYRKVELIEASRRRSESREVSSRPSSTDSGARRSLTPTRIYQPVPKPWTATVTSGTNLYQQAYVPPEPPKVCRKFHQKEVCQRERICERSTEQPYREEHRSYRAEVCHREQTIAKPPLPVAQKELKQEEVKEVDTEVIDLRAAAGDTEEGKEELKEVDTEVTDLRAAAGDTDDDDDGVYPAGEHDLITEVTEEDLGNMHVKKTTILEKTVELLAPERFEALEDSETRVLERSETVDREVEGFSERKTAPESAEVVTSAIDAQRMLENAKREEEEVRREAAEEERRREEEEKKRKEEEDRRREEEARRRREEEEQRKKRVSFNEQEDDVIVEEVREQPLGRTYVHEERVTEEEGDTPGHPKLIKETYEEVVEEVLVQERIRRRDVGEDQRRRSLREQVEVHQSLRDQEKRQQNLQERRLTSKCGQPAPEMMETSKKHVQFMKQTDSGPRPIPHSAVGNSTPKEWKSEMVNALTTAPERSYTPLSASSSVKELYTEETIYLDHRGRPIPPRTRAISPFQEALTIAPERPYTPLSREIGPEDQNIDRAETPVVQPGPNGYCPPADILYGDARKPKAEAPKKPCGPRPLPTPPPDYRLRDSSPSPCRSRPTTPSAKSFSATLKRPDAIPSYQKNLVATKRCPVEGQPFAPSRTPTPTPGRSKSPAQGPPEPPSCYAKAHAPRVRDDPPPAKGTSVHYPSRKSVSYRVEEDTDTGHKTSEYAGSKTVFYDQKEATDEKVHAQYQERRIMTTDESSEENKKLCHSKRALEVVEDFERCESRAPIEQPPPARPICAVKKVSRTEPSLPCPFNRGPNSGSVVPLYCNAAEELAAKSAEQTYSSSTEVRHVRYESSSPCPETGLTVLPCEARSDRGSKAGVVVVPCEGPNPACSRSGVCVVPTGDRSGVCVSPCFGMKTGSCGQPSGRCGRESACEFDLPNCPESGVCVTPCPDGSVCVAPCGKPGQRPSSRANIPFPQIPLPYEQCPADGPGCSTNGPGCSSNGPGCSTNGPGCSSNGPGCSSNGHGCSTNGQDSFEPIHKPRTNLSGQLARLTAKCNRDVPTVKLYKPQARAEDDSRGQCESWTRCQGRDQCQTQNHCRNQAPRPSSNTHSLVDPPNLSSHPDLGSGVGGLNGPGSKSGSFAGSTAPKRGRGILNQAGGPGSRLPLCAHCNSYVRGPFITALGQIWCPEHFVCVNAQCRRQLQDIGFVEEKGQLYCEYCFERFIAPSCSKCNNKIKGDCLNAIGKHFHPECFNCAYCGKLFGNSPFFLEEGSPYCEADWNELFTTKCFACGFPVEAGDRWVEALNNNYHSQCFNCTMCKKNLEGQSFYAKGGRPYCKNHAR